MNKFVHKGGFVCTFFALILAMSSAKAQSTDVNIANRDSIVRSTSIYFKFDVSDKIDSLNHQEMQEVISWIKGNEEAKINICGWSDKIGASQYNKALSERRAKTAKKYLIEQGVEGDRIDYIGMGIDYESPTNAIARRSTIMAVLMIEPEAEVKEEVKPEPKAAEPEVAEEATPEPTPAAEPAPEPEKEKGKFSLRTNLLYDVGGLFNIGAEWQPADTRLGILLNGGYSPFGGDNWEHSVGGWFVSPEIRCYLGEKQQWFVAAQFLTGGYNYKFKEIGRQGNATSGGLNGGYKMELNDTFDMDFNLGVGYGKFTYDRYYHEQGVNIRTEKGKTKSTFMPIQAGVNLIWKIQ